MLVRKQIVVIVLELSILLLGGCHSQKEISREVKPGADENNLRLISLLEKRDYRFKTLKIKRVEVDLSIKGGSKKVRGNIAIYRDSMIVVSIIPVLGYEMLRIMCTEDSVIVINRTDKSYCATSFEHYREKYGLPIGFKDLGAMLTNEVFYYKDNYEDRVYERKLNKNGEKNLFMIDSFRDGRKITNQGMEIDSEGRKLENVFITDYERKMRINLEYSNFAGNDDRLFPRNIKVNLIEKNNSIKMEIHYGQIVFDDSIRVEFSHPTHYKRVDI